MANEKLKDRARRCEEAERVLVKVREELSRQTEMRILAVQRLQDGELIVKETTDKYI